ncbi:iron(III) transport system substrate-binding protein [Luteibacter sp. W1I16]|uniref:ABC transporter substrate-binding protein n=1 Tax=Luteibacter sp. W1I16 TaxID=3373922 RepID=UPI003D2335F1
MNRWLALFLLLVIGPLHAAKDHVSVYPARRPGGVTLDILGSTDTGVFDALIEDYRTLHPSTAIRYRERGAQELYTEYLAAQATNTSPDLVISSAMDLQSKLVNDGHALAYESPEAVAIPAWAQWRHEIYGFSYEPVVMVYNTRLMRSDQAPASHKALLAMLLDPSSPLLGRIGIYDARSSSVGYFLATQDARVGQMAAALSTALGHSAAHTDDGTTALLDRIERGELTLGYNLLGSYAQVRIEHGAPLAIVQPQDYTLAISRTVLISKTARQPREAAHFVDYLLSRRGQAVLAQHSGILPIRIDIPSPAGSLERLGPTRPIPLGPELLVYLDQMKRAAFLKDWDDAMRRETTGSSDPIQGPAVRGNSIGADKAKP